VSRPTIFSFAGGLESRINDAVRLNIRPFMRATIQNGWAGAGILRMKPNIKWGVDRGKEQEAPRPRKNFPWFWSCPGEGMKNQRTSYVAPPEARFDGRRWNNLRYTNAVKREARRLAY